jgi:Right handed beta helix region
MITNIHLLSRIVANNMGYSISKTVCLYVFAIFNGSVIAASQFISLFSVEAVSDTVTPTITIIEPEPKSTLHSGSITVKGTARDNTGESGIKQVEVKVDVNGTYKMATPKATGDWSTWSTTVRVGTTGDHRIIAKATDNAGNQKWANIEITIGSSRRTLTIDSSSDGPGIQSAIDHLAEQGGGIVILKNGTYDLSTRINLKSNIEIKGESRSGVLLKRVAGFQEAFLGSNVDNVKISDLTVDIGESPKNNNGISVVIFNDSNDVTLEQLTLKNSDKMGILLRRTDSATVDNVEVYNTWTGISLQSARHVTVSNSLVSYTLGDGIYITNDYYKRVSYSSEDVLVTGNTVEKFADTGIDDSVTSNEYTQKDIRIEGNTVRNAITSSLANDNNRIGITISRTTDVSVSKCIVDNVDRGIFIGNRVTNANGASIYIVDNIVKNFDNYGIMWEGDSSDMILRNNKIINAGM